MKEKSIELINNNNEESIYSSRERTEMEKKWRLVDILLIIFKSSKYGRPAVLNELYITLNILCVTKVAPFFKK